MNKFITALAAGVVACFPQFATAQQLSAEEILAKLNGQAAEQSRDQTRGAKIYDGGAQAETTVATRPKQAVREERVVRPVATNAIADLPNPSAENKIDLIILFEFDSAFIRPSSRSQLSELCSALSAAQGDLEFVVVGHTDASGSAYYNRQLSQKRADEVKRHLVQECGVARSRLRAVGAGEERLRSGFDPRDEQQRRVEIIIDS